MKKRKLSLSVRDESLDLSGFLVIHCDVCSLPVLHCEILILLNRKENAGARRGGRLPSLIQEQHWLVWDEAAVLLPGRLSDCFRTRTRRMRARVEVPRGVYC